MSKKRTDRDAPSPQKCLDFDNRTSIGTGESALNSTKVVNLSQSSKFIEKKYERVDRAIESIMSKAKNLTW